MKLLDGTVLMHGDAPYDPVKAHDYYIRTRKLKGRKKGVVRGSPNGSKQSSASYTVKLSDGSTVKLSQKQLDEQRAYAVKRVEDIKKNLSLLGQKLKELMAQAQAQAKSNQPPTAAQKAKAAQQAKQYRQSHRQQLANKRKAAPAKPASPTKPTTATVDPVAELQQKITQIKGALSTAVAKQRELLGATKNG